MADAGDSKSPEGNLLRVRLPPLAWPFTYPNRAAGIIRGRPRVTCRDRIRCGLLVSLLLAFPACDRDVTDPTIRDDDVEALLVRAGLAPAGDFTVVTLLHDAIRTVQHDRGTEAARLELERIRAAGAAHEGAERRQLGIVLQVLGPGVLAEAAAETEARLARLATSIDSLPATDAAPLRATHDRAVQALALGGRAVAAGDSLDALAEITRAAALAVELRRALLLRNRVEALPELFRRARSRLEAASQQPPPQLQRHGELVERARRSVAHGKRLDTHRALQAVRAEELRLTIATLGSRTVEMVVAEVDNELERLAPLAAGKPRTQRMHAAAHDLAVRARRELTRDRPEAALDLGSHAAGLANALRLALTPR